MRSNHLDAEGCVQPQLPILTVGLRTPGGHTTSLYEALTLYDTGGTANFISLELSDQLGCDPIPDGQTVSMGNSSRTKSHGVVTLEVALDLDRPNVKVPLEAHVVETLGFPLILGFPFICQYCQTVNYRPIDDTDERHIDWVVNGTLLRSPLISGIHSDTQLHHMGISCQETGVPMVGVCIKVPEEQQIDKKTTKASGPASTEEQFKQMLQEAPKRLRPLLLEFKDIFVKIQQKTGSHGVVATIPTVPGETAFAKQFPLPQLYLNELKRMLQELIDKDWVQPAHSAFNNPIFLVPKPNNKWRIVLDFRGLNAITVKDRYRLPRPDHLLTKVMGWNCLSTMDLVDGFYQIPLAKEDQHKTAFSTPWGSFQWTVMPMGLTNAPSIFQGVTDTLLKNLEHSVGYIDDLATGGKTEAENDIALRELFTRLRDSGYISLLGSVTSDAQAPSFWVTR